MASAPFEVTPLVIGCVGAFRSHLGVGDARRQVSRLLDLLPIQDRLGVGVDLEIGDQLHAALDLGLVTGLAHPRRHRQQCP